MRYVLLKTASAAFSSAHRRNPVHRKTSIYRPPTCDPNVKNICYFPLESIHSRRRRRRHYFVSIPATVCPTAVDVADVDLLAYESWFVFGLVLLLIIINQCFKVYTLYRRRREWREWRGQSREREWRKRHHQCMHVCGVFCCIQPNVHKFFLFLVKLFPGCTRLVGFARICQLKMHSR